MYNDLYLFTTNLWKWIIDYDISCHQYLKINENSDNWINLKIEKYPPSRTNSISSKSQFWF